MIDLKKIKERINNNTDIYKFLLEFDEDVWYSYSEWKEVFELPDFFELYNFWLKELADWKMVYKYSDDFSGTTTLDIEVFVNRDSDKYMLTEVHSPTPMQTDEERHFYNTFIEIGEDKPYNWSMFMDALDNGKKPTDVFGVQTMELEELKGYIEHLDNHYGDKLLIDFDKL